MALVYNEETGNFDDIQVPPIIRNFRIQESVPFFQGDRINITWQIDGANHIFLNEEEQTGNTIEILLDSIGHQHFKIKATNSDGIAERDLTLEVVPCPKFEIYPSTTILHKGRNENVIFRWNIENARDIKILNDGDSDNISPSGEATFSPIDDSIFIFEAKGIEGNRVFRHSVPIKIREAAFIDFMASRLFSYPNLPIKLSWVVNNAVSVLLEGFGEQPKEGNLVVTPGEDTTYVLKVIDSFGEQRRTLTIRMLPLPTIKELWVPAPKINKELGIRYNPIEFDAKIKIPQILTNLVKIDFPKIPELKDSPFFVKNLYQKRKRKLTFKNLYTYFFEPNKSI